MNATKQILPGDDLTVKQFCAALNICRGTFYKRVAEGEVTSYTYHGRRLIPKSELAKLAKLRRQLLAEAAAT